MLDGKQPRAEAVRSDAVVDVKRFVRTRLCARSLAKANRNTPTRPRLNLSRQQMSIAQFSVASTARRYDCVLVTSNRARLNTQTTPINVSPTKKHKILLEREKTCFISPFVPTSPRSHHFGNQQQIEHVQTSKCAMRAHKSDTVCMK